MVLSVLYRMRRLRGTVFDPFGHTLVRRTERRLIAEYEDLLERSLAHLTPDTVDALVEIAALPDLIRGYEHIKLAGVERYYEQAVRCYAELTDAPRAPGLPVATA